MFDISFKPINGEQPSEKMLRKIYIPTLLLVCLHVIPLIVSAFVLLPTYSIEFIINLILFFPSTLFCIMLFEVMFENEGLFKITLFSMPSGHIIVKHKKTGHYIKLNHMILNFTLIILIFMNF